MTSRPKITAELSAALEKHIDPYNDTRIYWAREVTFDYSSNHSFRVDYMLFKPINQTPFGIDNGDFYCYEIKSSKEDFKSKNGHNFVGDLNYYVIPENLFATVHALVPCHVGVYILSKNGLRCAKKARRMKRERPACEMLLMMWRSSRRDLVNMKRRVAAELPKAIVV